MINIKKFCFNYFRENCYILWDESGSGVVIDPGCLGNDETQELLQYIAGQGISVRAILLTHGHFDHIFGVVSVSEALGVPVYMSDEDASLVREGNHGISSMYHLPDAPVAFTWRPVSEGDELRFGNTVLRAIATPGHTPGGICWHSAKDRLLLTGDTLFAGTIGRTDTAWGDYDKLILSIMEKLMFLDGDTEVLPGHGPSTNIGYERTHNPFLQPFNEPDGDIDNEDGIYIQAE